MGSGDDSQGFGQLLSDESKEKVEVGMETLMKILRSIGLGQYVAFTIFTQIFNLWFYIIFIGRYYTLKSLNEEEQEATWRYWCITNFLMQAFNVFVR